MNLVQDHPVGPVFVHHNVDVRVGGNMVIEHRQEFQELDRTMAPVQLSEGLYRRSGGDQTDPQ